ncbi:hypothetical protein [Ralstonia mannitolilytica]|uniref:hypothetical protein n=1 Tax=Ralstonia mannitolilytica TaxID=105219 RepID=UPI000DFC979C|nr:hypothetical protein [Ralstonia mannitolilytica]SUD93484.1 Uncharacterised protein [Ralstonia mannitolilytica]
MRAVSRADLPAAMVKIARDVVDVLTQLLAFLGRQLALRTWSIGVLATAVFHGGGTSAALFAASAVRLPLPAPFLRSTGLHGMSAAEKAAEAAKTAAVATRVRRQASHAQAGRTSQQHQMPPKYS